MGEENKADVDSTETVPDEDEFSEDMEDSLVEGLEKVTEVLDEAAEKLYALAESFEVTDEEMEEINAGDAGKTQEEIDEEDAWVAQITAPIVDALDAATAEIYGMTEKVLEMTEGFFNNNFSEKD
ncbi:hypothetical protein AGMMS49944_12870 [Spirochaetia bacterium]|nr:hypothetical protein AGMMS49944_12870 [Spirochaetia bacterium]